MKIAVVGLGAGYALACALAEADYSTIGVDIDPAVVANPRKDPSVEALRARKSPRKRIEKNLSLTSSYNEKKLMLRHLEDAVADCN